MKFDTTDDLLALVSARPEPQPVRTGHEGLAEHERGTKRWLKEIGHWHATEIGGRRWVKGPVASCELVRKTRTL